MSLDPNVRSVRCPNTYHHNYCFSLLAAFNTVKRYLSALEHYRHWIQIETFDIYPWTLGTLQTLKANGNIWYLPLDTGDTGDTPDTEDKWKHLISTLGHGGHSGHCRHWIHMEPFDIYPWTLGTLGTLQTLKTLNTDVNVSYQPLNTSNTPVWLM